ncbi:MAG TPA: 3-deoxy-manno-octulosonate cytidylyltransferase [Bosea sp. (in: a-proteobacteria)]|jgi:3-deoxy-manno-octulosonate cytidylyltransferase (CMP-KDO synthetase)|uniref:3-deoxy-manno-octulosonate cytidylyltransferase n=1 Tax=Bosea sp. (in: a-proteobacteria) TaxID=1871050 RepID=UPI002DDD44E4|nr:3-deoxy-manno-octulosonate cytidylyltransferase [Bosea sp. (in: a-proteobacteria)]HEV2554115.1 3-deoxy-manno-octulosonate cytidylyltransferase [Bosea sp. (in: a-proteobacteria)]
MSDPLILIPARLRATRLPGKPLADIHGEPMIVRVWRRAVAAGIGPVAVATDSDDIKAAVEAAGGVAVMTSVDHPSGSDRIKEAADILDPNGNHDVIVNVQGDFPTLEPVAIAAAITPLADPAVQIATLVGLITDDEEKTAPSVVKMVGSPVAPGRLRALYFTRATAPYGEGPLYHHVGIYAYRRRALDRFVSLPQSTLEKRESLEQLRALEDGMRIDAMIIDHVPRGVDTPPDLDRARAVLKTSA